MRYVTAESPVDVSGITFDEASLKIALAQRMEQAESATLASLSEAEHPALVLTEAVERPTPGCLLPSYTIRVRVLAATDV